MENRQFKKEIKIGFVLQASLDRMAKHLEVEFNMQREINQHGFEAGLSLEAYFREQLAQYIPDNYAVDMGTIIDQKSYTAGECDVVIYDRKQVPLFWLPVSSSDRRKFIAFETTYAVIEVKQNLTHASLKDACEKIFAYKQLKRVTAGRGASLKSELINPPFGIIFAYSAAGYDQLESSEKWEKLATDFVKLNEQVSIPQRVNGLFILNAGYLNWVGEPSHEAQIWSPVDLSEVIHYFPESSEGECHIATYPTRNNCIYDMYQFLWHALAQIQLLPFNLRDYERLMNYSDT